MHSVRTHWLSGKRVRCLPVWLPEAASVYGAPNGTDKITRLASDAMPKILNFGVAVGSGVVTAITALISSIYMLAGKGRLVPQLKKLTYAIAPRPL